MEARRPRHHHITDLVALLSEQLKLQQYLGRISRWSVWLPAQEETVHRKLERGFQAHGDTQRVQRLSTVMLSGLAVAAVQQLAVDLADHQISDKEKYRVTLVLLLALDTSRLPARRLLPKRLRGQSSRHGARGRRHRNL